MKCNVVFAGFLAYANGANSMVPLLVTDIDDPLGDLNLRPKAPFAAFPTH